MSMLVSSEYRIVAASLRTLADQAEAEANAIDNGEPRSCGIKGVDMELMVLQLAMLNDGTINKGMVAEILGKSPRMVEKYVADGTIPQGMEEKHGHAQRWNRALIEYIANKKRFFRKQAKKYGLL